jgi:DNA helicase-2/ATP-dependent DNA helicase PcrA
MISLVDQNSTYLETLNAPQRQAVEHTEGPLLVLAGAGTGKTRVLITRLAHILLKGKAWPSQVLAVTFTNKASTEMRERVEKILGQSLNGLWLGTFHSIAAKILRRHSELIGLSSNFTIIDTDDQLRVLKQILKAENIDDKKYTPKQFLSAIEGWKDRGLTPQKVSSSHFYSELGDLHLKIYHLYQERLLALNATDFGDLLLHCLTIFTTHSDILEQYRQQFRYIMVDEYQDTNIAQYLWLRLLAQNHSNICCVGDDDQSIYGWRGAEVGNILRFERDFPGALIIRLEQNYRSTPHILGAASKLIAQNKQRLGKTLWTEQDTGERVLIKSVWDAHEEARWVAEEVENLQRIKTSLAEIAILVRAGFQTREFEEGFLTLGIPYRIIGGVRFYERQEIRDAIAYIRLIANPHDGLAFERVINTPRRGLGDASLNLLHMLSRDQQISLMEASCKLLETDELKGKARLALTRFIEDIQRWKSLLPTTPHAEVVKFILEESGYIDMWKKDRSAEAAGRLDNLKELVAAIAEFPDLDAFLEHVSLVMENNNRSFEAAVTIMTMHSAKGLEFNYVFLAGWEEGVFPSQRSLGNENDAEEERRLAYVGLTRAKKQAYISFTAHRQIYGQWQPSIPSRFISELPAEHICLLPSSFQRPKSNSSFQPQSSFSNTPSSIEAYTLKDAIPQKPSPFSVRKRVFHIKFGYGDVQETDGDYITVHFDHTGLKKVVATFLKAAD